MFNYRVVVIINPPERGQPAYLCLMWGGKTIVVNHTGSIAQAKRHIERLGGGQGRLAWPAPCEKANEPSIAPPRSDGAGGDRSRHAVVTG